MQNCRNYSFFPHLFIKNACYTDMKLAIRNFGIVQKADVELLGFTLIAGENDTGKSTVGKLIFSIVKALKRYEQDLGESKEEKIDEITTEISSVIYKNNLLGTQITRMIDRSGGFSIHGYHNVLFLENLSNVKSEKLINEFIDKKIIEFDLLFNEIKPNKDKLKEREKVLKLYEQIRIVLLNKEPKTNVLERALKRALISEFKLEISPKTVERKTSVSWKENNQEILEFKLEKDKITDFQTSSNNPSIDDVTFIDSPILLQLFELIDSADTLFDIYNEENKSERIARLNQPKVSLHIKDLISKMRSAEYLALENEDEEGLKIVEAIQKVISGQFDFNAGDKDFLFSKQVSPRKSFSIKSINTASGIKAFGIIQLLLLAGIIDNKSLLVIDEPETHLHPKWQIEYAKILVELVKHDIKVLVTSHSPYFIQAVKYYSEAENISDKVNFYLTETNGNHLAKFENVSDDLNRIFFKLSQPLQDLVWQQ